MSIGGVQILYKLLVLVSNQAFEEEFWLLYNCWVKGYDNKCKTSVSACSSDW
jgi:hypothetical protein